MNWLVYHIASGQAFFTGVALLLLAAWAATSARPRFKRLTGLAFVVGLIMASLIGMQHGHEGMMPAWIGGEPVTAKMIGAKLFTEYLLLVEIAGFLLLAGLVAAYHLAKSALDDENDSHNSVDQQVNEVSLMKPSQQVPVTMNQVQEEKA